MQITSGALSQTEMCTTGLHRPNRSGGGMLSEVSRYKLLSLAMVVFYHIADKCVVLLPTEKLCETPDGRRFTDGQEWHMDDCTFCHCSKGKVECSVEDCQVPRCKNPTKGKIYSLIFSVLLFPYMVMVTLSSVPGRCCPICLDTSCNAANGTSITAEAVWKEGIGV